MTDAEEKREPEPGVGDTEALARNLALVWQEMGQAVSVFLKAREEGRRTPDFADGLGEVIRTLGELGNYWLSDSERTAKARHRLLTGYIDLWAGSLRRMMGGAHTPAIAPAPRDRRFTDPEWSNNLFFDFVKQLYLITASWAEELAERAEGLDPHTRHKAAFYIRQIANALAPSNFPLTNPELLRETLESNADNLVRGMRMLVEDVTAGGGDLLIRQSHPHSFAVGKSLAITPGKVIYQNELFQLIQYRATTERVLKRPLLIVPPWINKFYILDLTPEKSFVRWAVDQGHTVFMMSWVNPDARHAQKSFEHYIREGVFEAVNVIQKITRADGVNAVGYCIGGTLLSAALAYAAATGDERIKSATLLAAQVDFTHAGDLKVFVDEKQLDTLERHMSERGYLDGKTMTAVFNLLRSNDLIWPYVINNYFRGREPIPFDLLYWNADATRMPAANHAFYLRQFYLENRLTSGTMELGDVRLDLKKIRIPLFSLATREDHIAPARSAFYGSAFFGGKVTFVLAASGHIAGVVNPPAKGKYHYWTGRAPKGDELEEWLARARQHSGSWWPHWQKWINKLDGRTVKARVVGRGQFKPIEDAPGSYVKVRG